MLFSSTLLSKKKEAQELVSLTHQTNIVIKLLRNSTILPHEVNFRKLGSRNDYQTYSHERRN